MLIYRSVHISMVSKDQTRFASAFTGTGTGTQVNQLYYFFFLFPEN